MNSNPTSTEDEERENLRKYLEDATHVTWAFSSNKFRGFKPEKLQVLDFRDHGYHTSYDGFVNNIADFILSDRKQHQRALLERVLEKGPENIDYHEAVGDIIGHDHADLAKYDEGYNKANRTWRKAITDIMEEL